MISLTYSRIQHNMPKHAVALTWKQVHGVQDWETCMTLCMCATVRVHTCVPLCGYTRVCHCAGTHACATVRVHTCVPLCGCTRVLMLVSHARRLCKRRAVSSTMWLCTSPGCETTVMFIMCVCFSVCVHVCVYTRVHH